MDDQNDPVKLHKELAELVARMISAMGSKRTLKMLRFHVSLHTVTKERD